MAVTAKIGRIRFDEAVGDVLADYRTNGRRPAASAQVEFGSAKS